MARGVFAQNENAELASVPVQRRSAEIARVADHVRNAIGLWRFCPGRQRRELWRFHEASPACSFRASVARQTAFLGRLLDDTGHQTVHDKIKLQHSRLITCHLHIVRVNIMCRVVSLQSSTACMPLVVLACLNWRVGQTTDHCMHDQREYEGRHDKAMLLVCLATNDDLLLNCFRSINRLAAACVHAPCMWCA